MRKHRHLAAALIVSMVMGTVTTGFAAAGVPSDYEETEENGSENPNDESEETDTEEEKDSADLKDESMTEEEADDEGGNTETDKDDSVDKSHESTDLKDDDSDGESFDEEKEDTDSDTEDSENPDDEEKHDADNNEAVAGNNDETSDDKNTDEVNDFSDADNAAPEKTEDDKISDEDGKKDIINKEINLLTQETDKLETMSSEERYIYPETRLEEAEIDGTTAVYGYWSDIDDSEPEPAAVAYALIIEEEGNRVRQVSENIENYEHPEDGSGNYVYENGEFRATVPYSTFMEEDGTYRLLVTYIMNEEDVPDDFGDLNDTEGAWDWEQGDPYEFTMPEEKTDAPINIRVDNAGRVSWTGVDGVLWYDIRLYENGKLLSNIFYLNYNNDTDIENILPFKNTLEAGNTYQYAIKSVSPDVTAYKDSDYVRSEKFEINDSNPVINDLLGIEDEEELVSAVESTQLSDDALESMRTDVISNKDIENNYKELEEKYISAASEVGEVVIDSKDSSVDVSEVEVVGAALNKITEIDFKSMTLASASEANPAVSEHSSKNTVCMDISADTKNGNTGKLDWPVVITMKVPGDIPLSLLRIYHYRDDGEVDIIRGTDVRKNNDGTISFAITHFSLFVFVEESSGRGHSGSGGGGGSSVTTLRPNGTWKQNETGWWFEKNDGGYPADTWYECYWNGEMKWYHFNSEGYLDAGWFTDKDGQTYFLHDKHDNNFGYMYTGWNWIDGRCYYFSQNTIAGGLSKGSMMRSGITPDGYSVNENGEWTADGVVQAR